MKEEQTINGLPKDWKWEKLGEACEVITGTTPPKSDPSNYGNEIPFFKPPHLWDGAIDDTDERLSFKGAQKARIVPPNTVLVTCIGNLGRTGFVKKKAAFNQQLNAILENENISGKYIFYHAQSPLFKSQLEKLATGTTVSIVNKGNFETINIPVPPKETQQQIVSKIEELFSELDKGIEELKTAQQQLKIYRQAVLKWAFEGKLTNEDVKDGELPEGWKWVKLGEQAFVTKLAGFEFTKFVRYKDEGDIPVIRAQNVSKDGFIERNFIYVDREIMEKLSRSRIYGGEILMVFVGAGLGNVGIVPSNKEFFLGPNVAKIQLVETYVNKFIYYFLSSTLGFGNVFGKSKATAQGSISMGNIREVIVPLVPIDEQQKIVRQIESRLSVCDKIEETITDSLKQAEVLRQSILKKAFEGKLL